MVLCDAESMLCPGNCNEHPRIGVAIDTSVILASSSQVFLLMIHLYYLESACCYGVV